MNGLARQEAPFCGRVWQEIDRIVGAVRAANCTARRFLEVDGPYGLGLTSVAGEESWLPPNDHGADYQRWHVRRPPVRDDGAEPAHVPPGTYLVRGESRPVPLIASQFEVGIRAVDAYEAGCQPLDLCRATRAARDVALEEERLLYYGSAPEDISLLRHFPDPRNPMNVTPRTGNNLITWLNRAVGALAGRGFAGPFALVVEPGLYQELYTPFPVVLPGPTTALLLIIDVLRSLFRGGIYLVPVIDPARDPFGRQGAIITVGSAYSRLIVGQDWVTSYRGRDGMLYRFLIMSSLQLRVCEPPSIELLIGDGEGTGLESAAPRATRRRQ
jgi:uncharacterized linocin/CFP29 family protein